ncbi:MAG TPA: hypothetical protein VFE62_00520, partial [Gemmataceae bacterium]|nr:hypothetical protein [Gemmataceae bacterium]
MNCFLMISLLLTQPQDAKTTFPPAQGAPELKAMKPGQDSALTPAQAEHAAKLIRDLESSKYQVRQEATAELKRLGPALVPLLMKVRTNPPSLETLCRVEMILREIMPVQAEASAGARSFFGIIKVNAGDTMPNRPLVHGTDHAKKHDRNNDWQKKSPLSTPKKDQPYDEDKRI